MHRFCKDGGTCPCPPRLSSECCAEVGPDAHCEVTSPFAGGEPLPHLMISFLSICKHTSTSHVSTNVGCSAPCACQYQAPPIFLSIPAAPGQPTEAQGGQCSAVWTDPEFSPILLSTSLRASCGFVLRPCLLDVPGLWSVQFPPGIGCVRERAGGPRAGCLQPPWARPTCS